MSFFIIGMLVGAKGELVVLICISQKVDDVEQLFTGFLSICVSSLENCPLSLFIGWAVFFYY